ncbi:phosphotransferase enzyme family protein [Methylococcus capsulatus]|uniref:phosphotransferase enzyme family protein n=1 Tax=Methylococcus capsulatus TaxID=414 RepID=UPI001C527BFB|nr:aminoglycoside phosphotransferase family protein [Methylococcus capsulatus]QXP88359.1 aminoglycoside phosphotransferase family protein [Methylococcus capsulatus]QXP94624.1 aminoglycoside phosphotransferase family protein [Methylococcus capsulatus]UQN13401.1 aminoglycoside phosphotransferase family protein [Methylococcus capsulatus]
MSAEPEFVAARFLPEGERFLVEPLGGGLINRTWLVSPAASPRFVLQRLNTRVFAHPGRITVNLCRIQGRVKQGRSGLAEHWPDLVAPRAGGDAFIDAEGGYWRAQRYLEGSRVLEHIATERQALEVGRVLGTFHAALGGIDCTELEDTLPDFHIAPAYLARLDAVRTSAGAADPSVRQALDFVEARRDFVPVLEREKAAGRLALRIIHGDPKLANILFDRDGERALTLIDLDTVKPGLVHYDIGDCLRSCCNRSGESSDDPGAARFDLALCEAILRGYLAAAGDMLTAEDRDHLYDAIRLIPLELGIRFLADHLAGDVYFRVESRGQNLRRARVQFRLVECIEADETAIRRIVAAPSPSMETGEG